MQKQQGKIGGVKISTFNYVMIVVACVLYGFLLYETVQVFNRFQALEHAMNDYIDSDKTARLLMQGSDILTEQVRLYTVTGELANAKAYFYEANVERRRDRGLDEMERAHSQDSAYGYLVEAMNHSVALMEREYYAMALTSAAMGYDASMLPEELREIQLSNEDLALSAPEQMDKAREMVFGQEYRDAKSLIQNNVDFCVNSIMSSEEQQQQQSARQLAETIARQRVFVTLLFFMNVFVFFFISVLIIRPLQVYIKCIGDNRSLQIIGSYAYEFKYLAVTYNNIYELNASNEMMLRHQAERDGLTGLLNRRSFNLLRAGMLGNGTRVAFLLVDVDTFKAINDTYGHVTGDAVLRRVASELKDSFRSSDYVARIGGDEFCVIITDAGNETARRQIKSKIDAMNERLHKGDGELPPVSLSVGGAFSDNGFDDALYERADTALYYSKEHGRRQCSFYEDLPADQIKTVLKSPAAKGEEQPT